jgi:hypothetical protein
VLVPALVLVPVLVPALALALVLVLVPVLVLALALALVLVPAAQPSQSVAPLPLPLRGCWQSLPPRLADWQCRVLTQRQLRWQPRRLVMQLQACRRRPPWPPPMPFG